MTAASGRDDRISDCIHGQQVSVSRASVSTLTLGRLSMTLATSPRENRLALKTVTWVIALLFSLIGLPAYAQSASTILGVVKDLTGAVVPGATVTVQNDDTAQTRTGTTGGDGTSLG